MQSTRQAILQILKEQGQATVDQLSEKLDLTPVTIRHHLDILRSERLVQAPRVRRRQTPGRPQHVYCLTEQASDYFPKNYVAFADMTLTEVRERVGKEEMNAIVQGVAHRMAADGPKPSSDGPFPDRLDRVVGFLNTKGYVARWEKNEHGYLLQMSNCPYQGLADRQNATCVMDMAMIAELLGATPQRLSWMSGGDLNCTYLVREPDGQPANPAK
ncbi:MAG TPA: ArsR family transcriptional regulator [Anaerolineae bacterium]